MLMELEMCVGNVCWWKDTYRFIVVISVDLRSLEKSFIA